MLGLGVREYVALGALVLALVLGWVFFDPTSTEGDTGGPAATISLGETVTPTPPATATPVPVHVVEPPQEQWLITYYEQSASGADYRSGEGFVAGLDFDIPDRPFPDFKPDAWSMKASNRVEAAAGENRFRLQVDGAVKVWVDDKLVAEAANGDKPQDLEVDFDHKGGAATVLIEVRDTGGPVRLRWER